MVRTVKIVREVTLLSVSGWQLVTKREHNSTAHMRYTYFEVENFKGIRKARLDLAPSGSGARVYTLVGLNESGKTTVLKAIDHFQPDEEVSPKQLGELQPVDLHSLIPIAERTNFNGEIIVRCGIELDEADIAAAKTHLRRESNGYRLESLQRTIEITDRYTYEDSRYQSRRSTWKGPSGEGYLKTGQKLRKLTYGKDEARWYLLASLVRADYRRSGSFPTSCSTFQSESISRRTRERRTRIISIAPSFRIFSTLLVETSTPTNTSLTATARQLLRIVPTFVKYFSTQVGM